MKKALFILIAVTVLLSSSVYAGDLKAKSSYGNWSMSSNMLTQKDLNAGMAKASIPVSQKGTMVYEFKAKYLDGLQDGKGGFGIHIFVDEPAGGKAWGEGKSYLLWINYDEDPVYDSTPRGLSAQIYKSDSHSKMELVQSVSLKAIEPLIQQYLAYSLPIKISVDGKTGMAKIYDPFKAGVFYRFSLGMDLPMEGEYVSLRTNSLSVSFSQ